MKTTSLKKTTSLLALASTVWFTSVGLADDTHEADRGLEGSLRAAINERHVHIHVKKGIVTLDGNVPTESDRQRIDALVRNTPGVAAVKDKLDVTLPQPGAVGPNASTVPVYATPPPAVAPPTAIVTTPAPLVIPEYPKLKVLATTQADQTTALAIAHQLRADALPAAGLGNVAISVANGTASLQGVVNSRLDHDAIIEAIQHAGGVSEIYDQLQVMPSQSP